MRKQVRQYLRRSLCGVLSAAMILTGSAISGMTVYAAQPDVENEGGGLTDPVDDSTDVTPSEGNEDAVQKPDEGSNPATDGENNEGDDDSNQEGSDDQNKPGDDTTTPGDDSSDDSSDGKDTGNEDQEAPDDEEVKDPDLEDKDDEDDSKPVIKKNDKGLMAVKSARADGAKQFYFYCEPSEDETESFELGAELWSNAGDSISTTSTSMTEWNDQYYIMEQVEGFAGWYTIDLTISDEVTESENTVSCGIQYP